MACSGWGVGWPLIYAGSLKPQSHLRSHFWQISAGCQQFHQLPMCMTEPRQLLLGNSLLSLSQDWRRLLLLLWIVSESLGGRKPRALQALCWGCGHCRNKPWGWAAPVTSPACQHLIQFGTSWNLLILLTLLVRGFASSNAHVQITLVN